MTSPIAKNGAPISTIFAPYVSGTKAAATGLLENGVDLCNLYAPISAGPAAPATGIKCRTPLVDLNTIFSAPTGALGFNGQAYSRDRGRGTATLTLTFAASGTWSIVDDLGTVRSSGSWMVSGGTAANYTVQYTMTGFANGPDPNGGSDSYTNGAATASALTADRSASCSASATVVSSTAANGGTIVAKLYFNGSLVSTSSCTFETSAAG